MNVEGTSTNERGDGRLNLPNTKYERKNRDV